MNLARGRAWSAVTQERARNSGAEEARQESPGGTKTAQSLGPAGAKERLVGEWRSRGQGGGWGGAETRRGGRCGGREPELAAPPREQVEPVLELA